MINDLEFVRKCLRKLIYLLGRLFELLKDSEAEEAVRKIVGDAELECDNFDMFLQSMKDNEFFENIARIELLPIR